MLNEMMHRTKIVATIGPASSSRSTILQMVERGMNVARLNFSHGSYEDHAQIAFTPNIDVYHRLNLVWGIKPVYLEREGTTFEELVAIAENYLIKQQLATSGDQILIMGGIPTQIPQGTNFLKIHQL